jgi:hypothetical protein
MDRTRLFVSSGPCLRNGAGVTGRAISGPLPALPWAGRGPCRGPPWRALIRALGPLLGARRGAALGGLPAAFRPLSGPCPVRALSRALSALLGIVRAPVRRPLPCPAFPLSRFQHVLGAIFRARERPSIPPAIYPLPDSDGPVWPCKRFLGHIPALPCLALPWAGPALLCPSRAPGAPCRALSRPVRRPLSPPVIPCRPLPCHGRAARLCSGFGLCRNAPGAHLASIVRGRTLSRAGRPRICKVCSRSMPIPYPDYTWFVPCTLSPDQSHSVPGLSVVSIQTIGVRIIRVRYGTVRSVPFPRPI